MEYIQDMGAGHVVMDLYLVYSACLVTAHFVSDFINTAYPDHEL